MRRRMRNRANYRRVSAALIVMVLVLLPARTAAQEAENRILPAGIGAVMGAGAGGYIALAVIVAEARMGRYVHDMDDVLGWRSLPVVAGGLVGAALGFYDRDRLEGAVLYGAAGVGAGAAIGWGVGNIVSDVPEGRWAGAAIGAGIGMLAGNLYGALNPRNGGGSAGGLSLSITIPF
jgi:hypothetical protein